MTDEPAPLAIDGGTPVRSAPWPAPTPLGPTENGEVGDAGDPVGAFEAALAERLGLPSATIVMRAGPVEAYRAAFSVVEPGGRNEAVFPDLLERDAATAARDLGWVVVPGEVDADTGALSARGIARAMSERTALAVVRHPFGHPATMTDIERLATDRDIALIEDITGALGASFRGTPAGRMGQAAVLLGGKGDPITRGACVVIPDLEAAARARADGGTPDEGDAAVALAELRALDEALTRRRQLAWELTFRVRGMRGITALPHGRWVRHAYARYVVRLRSLVWKRSLEETLAALRAEGIPCEAACDAPLHEDPAVVGLLSGDVRIKDDVFSIASRLPGELIAFPLDGDLTSKDMDDVADALRKIEAVSL